MISTFIHFSKLHTRLLFIISFFVFQGNLSAQRTATAGPALICNGGTSIIKLSAALGSITWQTDASGVFANIPGRTSDTLLTPPLVAPTHYRAITTLLLVVDTSTIATVSIAPASFGGTIITSPGSTVCNGTAVTLKLDNNVGNTIQWELDTTGSFIAIPGAQTNPYLTPPLSKSSIYRASVTSGPCPAALSSTVSITVTPSSVGGTAKADTNIVCNGTGTTIRLTGNVGPSIVWQVDTTGSFVDIPGATGVSYATGPLTIASKYRARVTNGSCQEAFSSEAHVSVTPASIGGITSNDTTICSSNSVSIGLKGNQGSIQWQIDTTGTFVNILNATAKPYVSPLLTKTSKFRAMVTSGTCTPASSTTTIVTVNPGTTPGTVAADENSLCSGLGTDINLSGFTPGSAIQWQSKTTGAFADIPGADKPTYSTGPLTTTAAYRAIVEKHGCPAISNTVTVTINAIPVPGTAAADVNSLCSGTGTNVNLSGASPGATIQWQSKTTGAFANIPGANNATYSTGALLTTTTYQAIVTKSGCSATSNAVTVTINAVPAPGTAAADANTLCSGSGTNVNLSGATPGAAIQWQSKTTGAFADIPGANNATYATGALTTTTTYQAIVTNNGCTATSNAVTVTINAVPSTGTATADQNSLCSGAGTNVKLTGFTPGTTIQWQSKTTGAFADIPGANNTTYTTGALTITTTYQAIGTSNGCSATSNAVTVTVNTNPTAGTATADANTLCSGSGTSVSLSGATPGATIQWQSKTTGAFADIAGANSTTYATGALATTTTYQAIVGSNGCSATSNAITITVNATPSAGTAAADVNTLCSGAGTNVNLSGASPGAAIQWQSKTTGAFADIPGANNATYATGTLSTNTTYQAIVTNNGCSATSNSVTVTVNTVPLSGTAAADANTLCSGSGTNVNLSGATPGATIQWQSKTTGAFTNIPGANNTTYPTGALTTTSTYQAIVTNNGCTATSNSVTVTVNTVPAPGTAAADANTLCSGTGTNLNLSGATPGAFIQWQSKTTGAFTNIPGANNTTYVTGALITTTTYQAVVTNNGCSATSNATTVTINTIPSPGTAAADANTLCSGGNTQIKLSGQTPGASIQWQSKTTGGFSNVSGANSATYATGPLTITTTYQAVVSNNGCSATSTATTVTVTPAAIPGTISAGATVLCEGDSTTITLANSSLPIQWQNNSTGSYVNIPNATNTTCPTHALISSTSYRAIVGSNGCTVFSPVMDITVNPRPIGGTVSPASSTTCIGTSVLLTLKNAVGTIQWQTNASGTFADINGETDVTYQTPNLIATTDYQVVLSNPGCPNAIASPAKVIVAPVSKGGTATATPSSVCKGQSTTIKLTGYIGAIQWQRKTTGSFSDITGEKDSVYITPNLTTSTTYRAIVRSSNCAAAQSTEAVVSIAPSSVGGTATADSATICSGTSTAIHLTGYNGTIRWQSDASGSFSDIGVTSASFQTPNLTKTTSYKAIVQSNSCPPVESSVITVSIAPASVGGTITAQSSSICSGASAKLSLAGYLGNIQWQKNDGAGWVNISGATGQSYTSPSLTVETDYRAAVTNGHCIFAYSNEVTISIIPALLGGEAKAVDATICSGTSTTINLTGQTGNYQWQTNASGSFVNIPGATDSAYRTPNLTTPTSYRAIVSSGTCPDAVSTEALVNIIPASKGGTASSSKTICSGTSTTITLAGYNGSILWQVDANNTGTYMDIPNATGTDYATPILTKNTNYRAKVTSNNCAPDFSNVVTITVDPPSIAGTITASATAVCTGSTVTLTLNGSSGNIQWQSDVSGSFADISLATGATYTTFALTKVTSFRAVVKKGNCPAATTAMVTVTIAPALSGGTAKAVPSTVCKGTATIIHLTGHTGSIQWQSDASGSFADIPNAKDTLYDTPNLSVETKYRAIVSSANCASAISTEADVSVIPASEPGTIAANQNTICSGTAATLTLSGNVGAIQWQMDATGTFVDIPGATGPVYTTPTLTQNTSYRTIVTSTGCSPVTSAPVLISITPASQGGIATPLQSSVCSGGSTTINLTGELGTTIQWQSDASGSYVDIPGATGNAYTTPSLNSPTHYRARVRNGTCSMANSNVVLISITPALQGGTAKATPSTICKGTNTTISLKGYTGSQIQWQTNASGSYKDINGATDTLYVTPNLSLPTNYRARINGSGCSQVLSTTAAVSIIPQSVGGTSSANPATVCSGETSVISVSGSVGTIQWQTDESGSFVDIPGATAVSYTTPPLTTSTSYRAVLTSNHCASEKSTTALVSVTPASNGGFAKASATTVCTGGTTTITLTGYTGFIQWQTDASGTFVDIPGATGTSYTTPSLTATTNYRATVINANCAAAQSNTVEITITPTLKGGIATPISSTICKGTFTTINLTGYSGSIQWQTNASGTFKDITGATSSSYTTPALTIPTTFRAVVSSGNCTPATSTEATIAITPSSVGGTATANFSTICSGQNTIITLKGYIGSIQWQTNESGTFKDIPNETGTTYTTPALTSPTSYRAVVTSTGCSSTTSTEALVSVAPGSKAGTATATALKVCSGGTTTLTLNGYTGSIQWQTDASGTFSNISGATGTSYTTPGLTTPTNYRAIVTNGNCPSVLSNVVGISITPALSGGTATASPATICKGTKTTITLSNHSGAVQWQTNASGSFMDISGATDTFYVTPALTVPTNYQAVVSSGGCAPTTSTVASVSLTPASAGGAAVAAVPKICNGENTIITLTGYAGAIQWQTNASGTFVNIFGSTGNTYTTPSLSKVTSYRAIVTNGSCLSDTSTTATVDILPASVGGIPTATATTICKGGTTTITLTKYTGTIQWQTNASGVFTNIPGAIGVSYSTPILTLPTQYKAIVTSANCSPATSSIITIDVTDALEGGYATASPATVCDSTSTSINLSSYKGLIQWQKDSSGTFVNIKGATSTPYVTPPLKINTIYRALLTSGSCPSVYSTPVTAYVTPNLWPGMITAYPNTICSGSDTKLKIKGYSGNVQWQRDSLGIYVNMKGQTADTCLITSLLESTRYRAKISSGNCTPVYADSILISVNVVSTPTGDSIQKFCSVTTPTLTNLVLTDITTDTVKWYASPVGGTALANSTPLVNGTTYYAARSALGCESYKRLKITVTVFKSANVATQPNNITTCPGLTAHFSVAGDGTGLTYKWMVDETGVGNYKYVSDGTTYKGSNTDTLKVLNVSSFMSGFSYKCVVRGTCSPADSALSTDAVLTVSSNTAIHQQPTSISMCYGNPALFSVNASGAPGLSYQWQIDSTSSVFVNLKNDSTYKTVTTSTLKITAFSASMENYQYRCAVTSPVCGTVIYSDPVTISFDDNCNVYPLKVPTGFSPNGDGVNDKLVIDGIENYPGAVLRIYNSWGDLVFEQTDYKNDWDAKANVKNVVGTGKLPAGTYYIYVDLKNGKKGKATFLIIKY
jgi:gliding motility-associated-like protein